MGDVELIIICAGTGYLNPSLDWSQEKDTIDTNVYGFTALAGVAMRYFIQRKSGHLVALSSIAAIRGSDVCPSYNASKAFESSYLEGLRKKAVKEKLPIKITDIQPGLVDTAMARGDGLFWVAPPQKPPNKFIWQLNEKSGRLISRKDGAIIAWLFKLLPGFVYDRIYYGLYLIFPLFKTC